MKNIDQLEFPEDLFYTDDHAWVRFDDDCVVIGISDYAQDQLGEIVFVELPEVGDEFEKGQEFGVVESVKASSELYMPLAGTITEINSLLDDSSDLVNKKPYSQGWLIKIAVNKSCEEEPLLKKKDYVSLLRGQ